MFLVTSATLALPLLWHLCHILDDQHRKKTNLDKNTTRFKSILHALVTIRNVETSSYLCILPKRNSCNFTLWMPLPQMPWTINTFASPFRHAAAVVLGLPTVLYLKTFSQSLYLL